MSNTPLRHYAVACCDRRASRTGCRATKAPAARPFFSGSPPGTVADGAEDAVDGCAKAEAEVTGGTVEAPDEEEVAPPGLASPTGSGAGKAIATGPFLLFFGAVATL